MCAVCFQEDAVKLRVSTFTRGDKIFLGFYFTNVSDIIYLNLLIIICSRVKAGAVHYRMEMSYFGNKVPLSRSLLFLITWLSFYTLNGWIGGVSAIKAKHKFFITCVLSAVGSPAVLILFNNIYPSIHLRSFSFSVTQVHPKHLLHIAKEKVPTIWPQHTYTHTVPFLSHAQKHFINIHEGKDIHSIQGAADTPVPGPDKPSTVCGSPLSTLPSPLWGCSLEEGHGYKVQWTHK